MIEEYKLEELVKVAKRDNNKIRPYLYVNPLQGKHIPVNPEKALNLYKYMAKMLDDKYKNENILIIGFAETATAIGAAIAKYSKCVKYCTQTTRERYNEVEYVFFTESHSHATQQSLIIDGYSQVFNNIDRIVFAEDEVTTGNTLCKLAEKLKERYSEFKLKFGIISILNSMSDERIEELSKKDMECQYVQRLPFEYQIEKINKFQYSDLVSNKTKIEGEYTIEKIKIENFRKLQNKELYNNSVKEYVQKLLDSTKIRKTDKKVLVLGTEEFMFPPMAFAKKLLDTYEWLDVKFHATTRSPILTSTEEEYPLHSRYKINSPYELERITYVYNLEAYDLAVILSDSDKIEEKTYEGIKSALMQAGCKRIHIVGKEEVNEN